MRSALACAPQRAAAPATAPPIVHTALRSPGRPLSATTRTVMGARLGHDFGRVRVHTDGRAAHSAAAVSAGASTVQRQLRPSGAPGRVGGATNWAFDTYNVTAGQLGDPEIVARFEALSRAELIDYRNRVADPAVQSYLDGLIAAAPAATCSAAEAAATATMAEEGRVASLPWVALARAALDRLHSRWTTNKEDVLAGTLRLRGEIVCAFDSNFNTTQRDPEYGRRHIELMPRLRTLETLMSSPVGYACETADDAACAAREDSYTSAYVRGHRPPIHFCPEFRSGFDPLERQSTVLHEFAHLIREVNDAGGYALPLGAQGTMCAPGFKFRAATDVLLRTADAIAGFVLHVGQRGGTVAP